MEFDTFLIIVAIVVILLFTGIASNRRGGRLESRMCRSCGAAHPPFAEFCRRCGQRLKM